jgi:hypothetical protein
MSQVRGVNGEAVVNYCEPLTTKEMGYYRLSRRVNNIGEKATIIGNNRELSLDQGL